MSDYECQQMICSLLLRKFRGIPKKALPKEIASKAKDVIEWCENESMKFDHKLALGDSGMSLLTEFGIDSFSWFLDLDRGYATRYKSDLDYDDFAPLPTHMEHDESYSGWITLNEFHETDILCKGCPFYEKERGYRTESTYPHCQKMKEIEYYNFPFQPLHWHICERCDTALFGELVRKKYKSYSKERRTAIKESQQYRLLCYRIPNRINEFVEYASNELIGSFKKHAHMRKYEMGKYREPLENLLRNTFIEEYLEFDKPFNKFIIKYGKL